MPLTGAELEGLVSELAERPGHEKVRALLYRLLVEGLGADSREIDFEKPAPEVRGRIDALLGRTVFELKSDLRRERRDAEEGLARYLAECEGRTGETYIGIATDGADFIAFFRRGGHAVEAGARRAEPERPRELLLWLRGAVALGEELLPDPHTIAGEFGRGSLTARRALDGLGECWAHVAQTPGAKLKRELWSRLLSLAYGADVGDDALFLQHTYLVIVAKAAAYSAIIGSPAADAAALLHGARFSELGIAGQSEPDFFDWALDAEGGPDLVMQIARQVARFRLQDIRVDILKALYESLIDPETRHDLGEYYTPDWLAARMVRAAVERPLEQRVMDPACGSGTFLFHAVRAALAAADAAGLPPAEAARRATGNVAGIEIHPVAVIFARVTYLLALMPALRRQHPGGVSLPVYLGDALQWNLARPGGNGGLPDMLSGSGALEIFVPRVVLDGPEPKVLDPAALLFPEAVAARPQQFDLLLSAMIELGGRSAPPAEFALWLDRRTEASGKDRETLENTYKVMVRLQNEGRNHIWGYVARNLARPVWLSSESRKADVVIGNPPWVAYRYMNAAFQERFREECRAARLWGGGKVATQQDLSAYFYTRAALLYMRRNGRVALVMPYAAMSRLAYRKFRQGAVASYGHIDFRLGFTAAWTFGPDVQPLFPVPSCVLFARLHKGAAAASLPQEVTAFEGQLPRRDAEEAEADACLAERVSPWPAEAADSGGSPYRRAFRQGATLVPRRLVYVERVVNVGILPPNPVFPLVRGKPGRQDKRPWKELEPPEGPVEREFLRPALLGESIAPFRVLEEPEAVIPWDEERDRLLDAAEAARRAYPMLRRWLAKTEALWDENKRSGLSLLEQYDYYGKLSRQFPIAPVRVLYAASGTIPAACILRDSNAVIEHKLYWAAAATLQEARYLCGILNSQALRAGVAQYQSQGQWGARDFDKYPFNLPIPRFDANNGLHIRLARAARTAERVAAQVERGEREYFVRTRKRIRAALAEHDIAAHMEELVTELLSGG